MVCSNLGISLVEIQSEIGAMVLYFYKNRSSMDGMSKKGWKISTDVLVFEERRTCSVYE